MVPVRPQDAMECTQTHILAEMAAVVSGKSRGTTGTPQSACSQIGVRAEPLDLACADPGAQGKRAGGCIHLPLDELPTTGGRVPTLGCPDA